MISKMRGIENVTYRTMQSPIEFELIHNCHFGRPHGKGLYYRVHCFYKIIRFMPRSFGI